MVEVDRPNEADEPQSNLGAVISPDGTSYAVAGAGRHLRLVRTATDGSTLACVSDGHDLVRGTARGVANVFLVDH